MSKYTRPPELTPEQRAANAAWFDRFVQLADQKLLVDKAPATTDAPGTDQQARAPVPRFLLLPANLSFVMNIPTNHIQVIADPFSRTTREFTIEMIHCRPPVDPEVVEMINTIEDVTCLPYIAPNTNGQAGYRWQCDPVEFSDCDRMSDDAMVGIPKMRFCATTLRRSNGRGARYHVRSTHSPIDMTSLRCARICDFANKPATGKSATVAAILKTKITKLKKRIPRPNNGSTHTRRAAYRPGRRRVAELNSGESSAATAPPMDGFGAADRRNSDIFVTISGSIYRYS
jgi:hypothetical protein